jgi:hypothetical protein
MFLTYFLLVRVARPTSMLQLDLHSSGQQSPSDVEARRLPFSSSEAPRGNTGRTVPTVFSWSMHKAFTSNSALTAFLRSPRSGPETIVVGVVSTTLGHLLGLPGVRIRTVLHRQIVVLSS